MPHGRNSRQDRGAKGKRREGFREGESREEEEVEEEVGGRRRWGAGK